MLLNTVMKDPLGVAREMDRLFDSMISSEPRGFAPAIRTQWAYPAVNLWEDENNFYVEAELPGMSMDDIEVLVTDEILTIRGARNPDAPEDARALRRERPVGRFERTTGFPGPIEADNVDAKFNHGVLTITLPKAEQIKPRRISVKTSQALPEGS